MGCSSGDVFQNFAKLCSVITSASLHATSPFLFSIPNSTTSSRSLATTPTSMKDDGTNPLLPLRTALMGVKMSVRLVLFFFFFILLTVYLPAYLHSTACRTPGHLSTTAPRVDHHHCTCRASTTTCISFHLRYIRSGSSHHVDHRAQHIR